MSAPTPEQPGAPPATREVASDRIQSGPFLGWPRKLPDGYWDDWGNGAEKALVSSSPDQVRPPGGSGVARDQSVKHQRSGCPPHRRNASTSRTKFTCLDVAKAAGLQGGKQSGAETLFHCPGPGHSNGDQHPSLNINDYKDCWLCGACGKDGTAWELIAFLIGVSPDDRSAILQWADTHGLRSGDGYRPPSPNGVPNHWRKRPITDYYGYDESSGRRTLYTICRVPDKSSPDRNGKPRKDFPIWAVDSWGLKGKGIELVPYRLSKITAPTATDVCIVEGEKCVHELEALGFIATTFPLGAGKYRDEYSRYFRKDQNVTLFPDNDKVGRDYIEKIALSLYGKVRSLKRIDLAGLPEAGDIVDWLQGRDLIDAAEELSVIIDRTPEWTPQPNEIQELATTNEEQTKEPAVKIIWELKDLAAAETWETEPLEWDIENLIPRGALGFFAGAPKVCKSLMAEDLAIHFAHALTQPVYWLGKYRVASRRVLYIAREDPLRRLKERALEINHSYKYPAIPSGMAFFLARERFHLTDKSHTEWLGQTVQSLGVQVVILDVLNRMIPGIDQMREMPEVVSILESINREFGVTLIILDHNRKPLTGLKGGHDRVDPFEMKGPIEKYGCADFMLCLARTEDPGRLQMYSENKDTDERPHFLIDVSPKGSTKPKFRFAGDIEKLGNDMKALGDANREKVLNALTEQFTATSAVAEKVGLAPETAKSHLNRLEKQGRAQRDGKGKYTKWRKLIGERVQGCFTDSGENNDE